MRQLSLASLGNATRALAVARELAAAERTLHNKLGAGTVVRVLGFPGAGGRGTPQGPPAGGDADVPVDPYDDVARAFRIHKTVKGFGELAGNQYARIAIPFRNGGDWFVLAIRRPAGEIAEATRTVRTAFITAALSGLALTIMLGIPLSGRLVRRLRRLRMAAVELARAGPGVELPVDRVRDEVGDLARTFALMQERLRHQEEARRAFVSTASHELRTPLASLDGMLELLDEDLRTDSPDLADAQALLSRARVQSRRLARLAADLLDLSRIDAEVELRSEPVELGEMSRAVLAEFELGTGERGIRTAIGESNAPVWALADPGSVARILRILLDNAVRVSSRGDEVLVELARDPEPLLRVRDQGPGVADDEREVIFERFHRGRDTTGQAGFGLGLAIGRELAERMGGRLELERPMEAGRRSCCGSRCAHASEEEPAVVA